VAETADILRERGHEVSVICAVPHKATAEGEKDVAAGYDVHRVGIAEVGRGFVGYLKHYLSFVFNASMRAMRVSGKTQPDVVWVSSPPLFVGLVGVALSVFRRLPFVLDVRDLWPESAVAAGQLGEGGRAFRIGKWLERIIYNGASAISCVSNPMADYLRSASGKPVAVVYNGVRRSMADDIADPEPAAGERRRIVYAGNLGRAQGLEVLIRAFGDVVASGTTDDWDLEFVGSGALEAQLKQIAAASSHPNRIRFHPPMSKREVMQYMAGSHLLFINLEAAPVFEKTIPSKVFDYMLVGRPILAGLKGEGAAILEQTGGNVVCEPSDRRSIAEAITFATKEWGTLAKRAGSNRAVATQKYSREEAVTVLEDMFNRVVAKKIA
jgi:glycosyltransferase involved in cell wall biosynthesis